MEEKIAGFIQKKILNRKTELKAGTSLFGGGVIDSVGHLQLITFLEKEFGVSFKLDEFTWDNFDTVEKIAALVRKKQKK